MKVFMRNSYGAMKQVKVGYSWTVLFFGFFVPLIRGDWKWSTSKKSVATVSSKGKVVAKKAGVAKITGKVNGRKYTCTVTVKEQVGSRQNLCRTT